MIKFVICHVMNINEQLEYINEHFPFESSVNSKKEN